jgi:hypothetical protein
LLFVGLRVLCSRLGITIGILSRFTRYNIRRGRVTLRDPIASLIATAEHAGTISASPGPLYNLACCESLAGRTDDAIRQLRLAIDRKESFRSLAAGDSDFDPIRAEAAFTELVQGNAAEPTTG